jgi:hypothetical protein
VGGTSGSTRVVRCAVVPPSTSNGTKPYGSVRCTGRLTMRQMSSPDSPRRNRFAFPTAVRRNRLCIVGSWSRPPYTRRPSTSAPPRRARRRLVSGSPSRRRFPHLG